MWTFNKDRLVALRGARGLSGETFATMLRTSKQHVSQWETGELTPSTMTILKIANIFDVSPIYFFAKSDHQNSTETLPG